MSLWRSAPGPRLTLGTIASGLLHRPFRLPPALVASHKHVIGLSGSGKSKLLALMAAELIQQGIGVAVLDPHADLASDILAVLLSQGYFARSGASERLLYIDFAHPTRHLPFNVLKKPRTTPHIIAQELDEVCKRAWSSLAGGAAPQFENILLASVVVLVENGLALTDLPRLLTEKPFRDGLLQQVTDPQVVGFFHTRFDRWGRETPAMLESTLRRAFLLTFSPTLRYSLGQPENALDFRGLMDAGTSVIVNLGGLDEATQKFLGCLITVGFETAALSRADLPPTQRRQYHLVLDEFSAFSAQSEEALARVLSMARKYGLYLTLAHQTFSQLSARLAGALQNTVDITFRIGRSDAEWAAPRVGHFEPAAAKRIGSGEREYPVSVQETFERWTCALEELAPRQAFITVGKQTVQVKTPTYAAPNCTPEELAALMTRYSERLLAHRDQVQASVDRPATPAAEPQLQRRVRVLDEAA